MALKIQCVEYYNANVRDEPGAAYAILSKVAGAQVNLLAFSAVPTGANSAQLVMFPDHGKDLVKVAEDFGLHLLGPMHAFLIQGDDQLGAFAEIHRKLSDAAINVFASSGVTDGREGFGYIVYVRPEEFDRASKILGL